MEYYIANDMEESKTTLYLCSVLLAFSLSMGIIAYPEGAYGERGNGNGEEFREIEGEHFHQAILKTDDKEYEIDADIVKTEGDFENQFFENVDAKDVKNLKLSAGEEVEIDFECAEGNCFATDVGDHDGITVYLVDKNEKDIDIAREDVDVIERIVDEDCFESLENCDLETTIPDDINNGKYKLVIEAFFDEGSSFFINPVKIKE